MLDSLTWFHAQLVVTAIEGLKVDHTAPWENKCWRHCLPVSSMALLQLTGQISCQSHSRLNHVQNASPSAKHIKTLELLKNSYALAFGCINQNGGLPSMTRAASWLKSEKVYQATSVQSNFLSHSKSIMLHSLSGKKMQ